MLSLTGRTAAPLIIGQYDGPPRAEIVTDAIRRQARRLYLA